MKNRFRKILSLLICLSMCLSLLSALPTAAAVLQFTPLTNVKTATGITANELNAAGFTSGAVLQYEKQTDGLIRIDVGYYNTIPFISSQLNFNYDIDTVQMTDVDGNPITVDMMSESVSADAKKKAIVAAAISDDILTDTGKNGFASNLDQKYMFGTYGPLEFNTDDSFFDIDEELNLTGDMTIVLYALSTANIKLFKNVSEIDSAKAVQSYPENTVMQVYSMYFEELSGKTVATDTFSVCSNTTTSTGFITAGDTTVRPEVVFVDFPVKNYNVNFTVTDGNDALDGATVSIYEKGSATVKTSATTGTDGTAKVSLPAGDYEYKVTKTGYEPGDMVEFTVSTGDVTIDDVALTKQTTVYKVTWKFTDAEDNPLKDVAIFVSSQAKASYELTTDANGTATQDLPAGSYTYSATLAGYVDVTDKAFTVDTNTLSLPTVVMTKSTEPVYEYKFKITDEKTGGILTGAKVVVYNETGDKKVAEATTDEDGIATFNLEAGSYMYSVTRGIAYVGTAMAAFAVSSTAADNTTNTVPLTPAAENEDPHYKVTGDYDDASGKYKVDVTLNNIQAVGASFGLKYDSEIFTLITEEGTYAPDYHDEIVVAVPVGDDIVSDATYDPTFAPQQNAEGYVTFGWYANNTNMVIDGTATERPVIVTYYFDIDADMLANDEWKNWIDSETFQVMDWTQTEQGAKESEDVYKDIWSVAENKYMGLPAIPTADGGYDEGDTDLVPIGMEFLYDNQTRYRLTFTVTEQGDADTTISGATIDIYDVRDADANLGPAREKADDPGVYEIVVDGDTSYEYIVKADDYWSNPESEARDDYNTTDTITAPTDIAVELRAKVYRDVTAKVTSGTIISESKGVTQDVVDTDPTDENATQETWAEHATEGVNLYFVTSPAAGYELDGTPQYTIGAAGTPANALFDAATNQWYVPGTEIKDVVTIEVNYVAGKFTVTANMNTGGTLTWGGTTEATVPVSKEYDMGGTSGELEFNADDDNGYEIYQVVINGSEYPFDDKDVFEYTFNDIRDDHTISVIFKKTDAVNPEEYVVSVLAGEYGKVDVSYDTATDTLEGEAAKDYIVPWDTKFTATATPDTSYEIDEVLKNGVAETLDTDRTKAHSVELDSSAGTTQSVVATFRAEGTEESIQYWIKTEIVGMGTIEPFGSRLYYSYETPTFKFAPAKLWKTESITFNGAEQTLPLSEHTFTELTEDIVIVATYTEIVQTFTGMVNFAQGELDSLGKLSGQTNPEVVFVRDSDKKEFTASFDGAATNAFLTGQTDKNFTVELPAGTYTITATKGGHLDYVITAFEVTIDEDATADVEEPGTVEGKIVLTPGNTNKDSYITFMDILRVVNGMVRYGEGAADIDETGIIDVNDMNYSKANYAETAVNVTYEVHKSSTTTNSN